MRRRRAAHKGHGAEVVAEDAEEGTRQKNVAQMLVPVLIFGCEVPRRNRPGHRPAAQHAIDHAIYLLQLYYLRCLGT